ncbi:MAG: 50S ribosome-binding GTPase, partial [Lentisphaeria bacterium]|nr:50S ribosome-binding GTPase [Lentisphaeria bacterium]
QVEDKLFATLDPTVRRLLLPNQQELLLVDTVGLIRKLPHMLVEAFQSTLEETITADFLVEVIDAAGAQIEEHHATTKEVLAEIGAGSRPVVTVLNKIDRIPDALSRRRLQRRYPEALLISAHTGENLDQLSQTCARLLDASLRRRYLRVPHQRYDIVARLHRTSAVLEEEALEDGIHVLARIPEDMLAAVAPFVVPETQPEPGTEPAGRPRLPAEMPSPAAPAVPGD